jgi:hypothetical protein
MPHRKALLRGVLLGVGVHGGKLAGDRWASALVVIALLAVAGYAIARLVLQTVVHQRGFLSHGWTHFDWSDVASAVVVSGDLKMQGRNGGPSTLPARIISDAAFREAIQRWLAPDHPVRRAVENVDGATG